MNSRKQSWMADFGRLACAVLTFGIASCTGADGQTPMLNEDPSSPTPRASYAIRVFDRSSGTPTLKLLPPVDDRLMASLPEETPGEHAQGGGNALGRPSESIRPLAIQVKKGDAGDA